ncbi:MAG: NADH:ubiquinone reductase (Na(+)-transporting) subunit C [Flavobacteriales bacterium]|nr:NADH:ubiquinone reductase (Na(+)-transporting) subunit C [Flavobacteriales bacterium]
MAINKNSTGYTIRFSVVLVAICGSLLALLATSLKEPQQKNVANEKRQFILSAAGFAPMDSLKKLEKADIEKIFTESVTSNVYNYEGNPIEGENAFTIDIVKEHKSTKNEPKKRKYPVFTYINGSDTSYVIPMAGNGLWGPVWGFAALGADQNTITGIVFDHKSETPGLGAKIAEKSFMEMFTSSTKMVMKGEKYMGLKVVKGGLKEPNHEVDAIAGATITSNGVSSMLRAGFKPYMKAWNKIK